jgi:excisionase family DNA binding protein
MTTINRGAGEALEPLVVRPNKAMRLLDCRRNYLYDLINAGELETYRDGRARKITMRSIRALIERRLKEQAA